MIITTSVTIAVNLPLNSIEMAREKDKSYKEAKKTMKAFEKKYKCTSKRAALQALSPYCLSYNKELFRSIKKEDRLEWWKAIRNVVASSKAYMFLIAFFDVMGLWCEEEEDY